MGPHARRGTRELHKLKRKKKFLKRKKKKKHSLLFLPKCVDGPKKKKQKKKKKRKKKKKHSKKKKEEEKKNLTNLFRYSSLIIVPRPSLVCLCSVSLRVCVLRGRGASAMSCPTWPPPGLLGTACRRAVVCVLWPMFTGCKYHFYTPHQRPT